MNVLRATVRGLGELSITAGLLMLAFVGWQLFYTDIQANREQQAITDELDQKWGDDGPAPVVDTEPDEPDPVVPVAEPGPPPELAAPGAGEAFAVVRIPRFGADYEWPVLEGTSLDLLQAGVGHYVDSAMPGGLGNFALAGHRVTYGRPFNQIAELRVGDPIVVETQDQWFVYRMRESLIVTPDRVDVVAPVPGEPGAEPQERLLTMTSCHPMFSARERYIVQAELESWQPKTDGRPDVLASP